MLNQSLPAPRIDLSQFTPVASLRAHPAPRDMSYSATSTPPAVASSQGAPQASRLTMSSSAPAIGSARVVAKPTVFLGPTVSTVPPSPTRSTSGPRLQGAERAPPSSSYVAALHRQRQEIADRVMAEAKQHRVTRRDSRTRSPSNASSTAALFVDPNHGKGANIAFGSGRPRSLSPTSSGRSPPKASTTRRANSPRFTAAVKRLVVAESTSRARILEAAALAHRSLEALHALPPPPPRSPTRRTPPSLRSSPTGLRSSHAASRAAPVGFLAPRLLHEAAVSTDDDASMSAFAQSPPHDINALLKISSSSQMTPMQRVDAELVSLRALKSELQARDAARDSEWRREKVEWAKEWREMDATIAQLKRDLQSEKATAEALRLQLRLACRALRPSSSAAAAFGNADGEAY